MYNESVQLAYLSNRCNITQLCKNLMLVHTNIYICTLLLLLVLRNLSISVLKTCSKFHEDICIVMSC